MRLKRRLLRSAEYPQRAMPQHVLGQLFPAANTYQFSRNIALMPVASASITHADFEVQPQVKVPNPGLRLASARRAQHGKR